MRTNGPACITYLVSVLLLVPVLCQAQTTSLESLKSIYKDAKQKVETESLVAYTNALSSVELQLKKAADVDGVLAVQVEQKRIAASHIIEVATTNSSEAISTTAKKTIADRDARLAVLLRQYVAKLEDTVRELLMANKIDDAKAVKAEQERMKFELADLESRSPKTDAGPVLRQPEAPVANTERLVVKKATYGAKGGEVDVTKIVQEKVSGGKLEIHCTFYAQLFGDPAWGKVKQLRVEYTLNGVARTAERMQSVSLYLPPDPNPIAIKKGTYGAGTRTVDITAALKNLIVDNRLEVCANQYVGQFGDPAPYVGKFVTVEYTHKGVNLTVKKSEGQELVIP